MFQRVGPAAFKKDLTNTFALASHLGNPQNNFKSIHIAGTNGKGSCANILASVLHSCGFKTGLYTSPHLKSFTERIRVNGIPIPENEVVKFVEGQKNFLLELKPSFFEMTVAMAFDHFRNQKVDFAVVEVGLGGRLDSTNILKPEVCLITNIGLDHTDFLGETLPEIAFEKAGIIKQGVPVVISEFQDETIEVFRNQCEKLNAKLIEAWNDPLERLVQRGQKMPELLKEMLSEFSLQGSHQIKNLIGSLSVLNQLGKKHSSIGLENVRTGIMKLEENTGFMGRWYELSKDPLVICDCAHNEEGLQSILDLINQLPGKLHVVWGTVADKNIERNLLLMPENAEYYYCAPDIPRKLDANKLALIGKRIGRKGLSFNSVNSALDHARKDANKGDSIFVGGSTFVVAEVV